MHVICRHGISIWFFSPRRKPQLPAQTISPSVCPDAGSIAKSHARPTNRPSPMQMISFFFNSENVTVFSAFPFRVYAPSAQI